MLKKRRKKGFATKLINSLLIVGLLVSSMPPAFEDNVRANASFETEKAKEEGKELGSNVIETELEVSDIPEELLEQTDIDIDKIKDLDDIDSEDPYSITTINEDDSKTLYIFDTPVKYYDEEENTIKFIDNTLTKSDKKSTKNGTFAYENKANSIAAYIPKTSDENVVVEIGDDSFGFKPLGNNIAKAELSTIKFLGDEEDVVEYKDVFGNGYDLHYIPQNDGIKENILIKENRGIYAFDFQLKAKGVVPAIIKEIDDDVAEESKFELITKGTKEGIIEGNTIYFVREDSDEIVYNFGELFMRDSYTGDPDDNDHYSFNNYYHIEDLGDYNYKITYVLDKAFLDSESTQYPVLVDPSITIAESAITSAPVYSGSTMRTKNHSANAWIQIGNIGGSYGAGRGYFRTTAATMRKYTYINPNKITSASLRLWEGSGTSYTSKIKVYDNDATWSAGSITYDNMPVKYGASKSTVTITGSTTTKSYDFPITPLFKAWLKDVLGEDSDRDAAYGVALIRDTSGGVDGRKDFCSSKYGTVSRRPTMVITYDEDTSLADGTYFLENNESGLFLEANTSTDRARQFNITGLDKQQWVIYHRSGDYYTIRNKWSGYGSTGFLSVLDYSDTPAADIYNVPYSSSDDWLRFKIIKNNDGSGTYRIMPKETENLKALYTSNSNSGRAAAYTAYNGNPRRQWRVRAVETPTVSMSPTTATMNVQTTRQLSATVKNAVTGDVNWTSSNTAVATVDAKGLVTAKAPGTVTITAASVQNTAQKATCVITVVTPTILMTPYYTTPLTIDSTIQLSTLLTNVSNTAVTWSSSNSNVATVSSSGLVTAIGKGTATITATLNQDTTKKVTCTITVTGNEERRFNGIPGGYAPTGNYSQTFTDMMVPSVLGDIPFSRTYNSLESVNNSIVGKGFHFNYSMRVIDGSTTYVVMPDNAWWRFTKNADGTYTAVDCRGTLEWDTSDNEYKLTTLDQIQYGFSSNGYLKYVEDLKGNRITVTTDSAGKITGMSDPSGLSISFTYSGNLLMQIKDNVSNRTVQYTYTTISNNSYLKTVTDSGDNETTYDYDSGLLTEVTEGELVKAVMTYDSSVANAGLIKTITYDEQETSTYDYTEKSSQEIKITDSNSDTVVGYNAAFAITKTAVYPKGETKISALTENTVNSFHEVTSTKDVLGNVTTYTYDSRGNNTSITYPDGSSEQFTYDTANNKRTHTDKMGIRTTYYYDAYHNLIKEARPLDGVTYVMGQYEYYTDSTYPIRSLLKKEIGALGNATNCTEYTYSFTPGEAVAKTVTTTKQVAGVAHSTTIEYDKAGRVTKETTPTGIKTINVYNPTTELLTRTEVWDNSEQRQTTTYEYDAQGEVTKETDTFYDGSPSGITKYEYDKKTGELLKTTAPDGTITEYTYDVETNVDTEVEKASDETDLVTYITKYDELGREIEETTEDNTDVAPKETTSTSYSYDTSRKVYIATVTDEFGGITVTETGWDGRVLKQKNPSGLVQINTYNIAGQVTREEHQDANGKVLKWTEIEYDDWGRVSKKKNAFDSVGESGYAETLSTYDRAGNVLTSLVKTEEDQYVKTENAYDRWGQKVRSTEYEGFFTATGDAIGNSIPRYTQTLYDWDGQVLLEATGLATTMGVNTLQVIYSRTTVSGYALTKNRYNNFRQLILKTDALEKGESYEYDHAGRTKKTTDRNGVVHEVKYDAAGRKTEENSTNGSNIITKTYQYDSAGNLWKQTEGATVIEYEYDGTGNVIKETSGDVVKTFSETKTKDDGKSTESIITEKGVQRQKVKKVYNNNGQLTAVYDNDALKASYTYDLLDRLIKTEYANGTSEENKYNPAGLVTSVINYNGSIPLQNTYTYYYNGNQRSKTDGYNDATTYTYDGRGQLVKSVGIPVNTSFANAKPIALRTSTTVRIEIENQTRYFKFTAPVTGTYNIESMDYRIGTDPYGKLYTADGKLLVTKADGGYLQNFKITHTLIAGEEYVIAVNARLISAPVGIYTLEITPPSSLGPEIPKIPDGAIVQEYTYDSNGNRLTMKERDVTTVYTYDKNDRLLTKKEGTQATVTYSYDDNGNMRSKTGGVEQTFDLLNRMTSYKNGTVTTDYTYYPDDMRKSKQVGNETATTHVWLGDEIALDIRGSSAVSYIHGEKLITSTYGWYLYNAHGDVTALTNASGNITKNYEYDAFGNQETLDSNGTDLNPYRYSGEYYDTESGYTYLRARYYDPSIGRFVNEDPIKDGTNYYIYAYNNPVNLIDPSGLRPTVLQAAYMAKHIYREQGTLTGGWVYLSSQRKQHNGLLMGVYKRIIGGKTEYAVVNKGTSPKSVRNWVNNVQQPFGSSADMKKSIAEAKAFVKSNSKNEVTFIGHSKGGAEAMANAVATNKGAILFNPATPALGAYGLSTKGYTGRMNTYIVRGDALDVGLRSVNKRGNLIGVTYLPQQHFPSYSWWHSYATKLSRIRDAAVKNHSMDSVISALRAKGYR